MSLLSAFLPWPKPPHLHRLLPQRAGHPLSPRGHPAHHPHAELQQPGPILPVSSAARWGRIYHMEIISLLFLKSVNQPHNHFLKNIPAIK